MLKIGILTFHASHNYGSMLQAYALQRYLESLGNKVEIINLRNPQNSALYAFPLNYKCVGKRKVLSYFIHIIRFYNDCKKWMKFERFLSHQLHLSKNKYLSWTEIKDDIKNLDYDIIITGGDQIWNVRCYDFDPSYYLPEQLKGIRKMSYCPSMGKNLLAIITDSETDFIKTALSDYDIISVRERTMQVFLADLLKKDIKVVVDPTFLMLKSAYDSLIGNQPLVKGEYIFYYSPFRREGAEKIALSIGEQTSLPVIASIHHNKRMNDYLDVGPFEYLNLIKYAKYVVGQSFHLIVFSLIFHKQFLAVDGANDHRMRNILELYGLEKRGDFNESNCMQVLRESIDFDRIDTIMEKTRMESQLFIEKSLQSLSNKMNLN